MWAKTISKKQLIRDSFSISLTNFPLIHKRTIFHEVYWYVYNLHCHPYNCCFEDLYHSEVLLNTIISQDNFFRLTQIDLKSLLNRHYALLGLLSVWINERMNQVIYGKDVLVLLVSSTCLLSTNRNQEMRLDFFMEWNVF